jgi:hypothetical protein
MSPVRIAAFVILVLPLTLGRLTAQGVDTIRVGDATIARSLMPLTTDTVDDYTVTGGQRQLTGTTIRSIAMHQERGDGVYEIRTTSTGAGDTTFSTMVVRVQDLSLIFHRVKARSDSAAVTVSRDHLTGWVVLPNQPAVLLDRTLEHPVFGVEGQLPWLLPLLPFTTGFRAVVTHFSEWSGAESFSTVAVVASERVTVAGRSFDCWELDTGPLGPPGYRMYRWVDKQSRRVIQSVLRGTGTGPEYWSVLRS